MSDTQQLDIERDALAEDAENAGPTAQQLSTVVHLGNILVSKQQAADELTARLNELSREIADLAEITLPEAMGEAGLTDFTLASGEKIEVVDHLFASISKENLPTACHWLRETNNDGIIKTVVAISFGKGEASKAEELFKKLRAETPYNPTLADSVHPSTLKSWVKEMTEKLNAGELPAEEYPPEEVFGIFTKTIAEVKREKPKEKKLKTGGRTSRPTDGKLTTAGSIGAALKARKAPF